MREVPVARRELLEPPAGEAGEVGGRALERREDHPARLVLERHRDVHPAGERLEQPPLRRAQVLEPVRVDRPAVPGGEVAGEPVGCIRGGAGRGPRARAGRARRGSGIELGEIAVELVRVEQAGLELGDRRAERVGETGKASRTAELVELRSGDDAAQDERALRVPGDRAHAAVPGRDPVEDVVEGPDRAAHQRPAAGRAGRALPVRRPSRSARSGPARGRCPRGIDREEARPCRRSPARP